MDPQKPLPRIDTEFWHKHRAKQAAESRRKETQANPNKPINNIDQLKVLMAAGMEQARADASHHDNLPKKIFDAENDNFKILFSTLQSLSFALRDQDSADEFQRNFYDHGGFHDIKKCRNYCSLIKTLYEQENLDKLLKENNVDKEALLELTMLTSYHYPEFVVNSLLLANETDPAAQKFISLAKESSSFDLTKLQKVFSNLFAKKALRLNEQEFFNLNKSIMSLVPNHEDALKTLFADLLYEKQIEYHDRLEPIIKALQADQIIDQINDLDAESGDGDIAFLDKDLDAELEEDIELWSNEPEVYEAELEEDYDFDLDSGLLSEEELNQKIQSFVENTKFEYDNAFSFYKDLLRSDTQEFEGLTLFERRLCVRRCPSGSHCCRPRQLEYIFAT